MKTKLPFSFKASISFDSILDFIVPWVVRHTYNKIILEALEINPSLSNLLPPNLVSMNQFYNGDWNDVLMVSWLCFDFEVCFNRNKE